MVTQTLLFRFRHCSASVAHRQFSGEYPNLLLTRSIEWFSTTLLVLMWVIVGAAVSVIAQWPYALG
jgi:hypothetical protein